MPLSLQVISTITLAILLSRLYVSIPDNSIGSWCYLGINGNKTLDLSTLKGDFGGKSCKLGVAIGSLSSLVCAVFLALDIFSRGGLLDNSSIRTLGIVDFTVAFVVCFLWLAQTIYAGHDLTVTIHYSSAYRQAMFPPPWFFVSACFFCFFCGLSVIIWVSQQR